MKRLLIILFIFWTNFVQSQNTYLTYHNVVHGDTSYLVRTTNIFSIDSQIRYDYLYHNECDSVLINPTTKIFACVSVIYDSIQYWYKYRTLISSSKDSTQLDKLTTAQLNNTAGFINGTALVPYTPGTRLNDSMAVIRNIIANLPTGGASSWGSITGTLANQTDLNTALSGKSATGHSHDYSTLTGLPALFDGNYNSLTNKPTLFTQANADALYSVLAHTHTFTSLTSKPTTLAGYGITDAALSSHNHSGVYQPVGSYLVAADIAGKQDNISLTTTGTSGAATFIGNTLNIPNYATGGGSAPTFLNLASNFSSTSVTPAAVTGWSFTVTTGKTYRITVIADYQTAATTTGGILGISLTTATGSVRGYAAGTVVNTAAATELKIPIRTTSGAGSTLTTTGVTAINSPHYIGLDITFTCTGSGTFNIVWGTEVAASAAQLNANSTLLYQQLN